MKLTISPSKVAWGLTIVVVLLTLVSLAARFLLEPLGGRSVGSIVSILDVGRDNSIPTWYSSLVLLVCSLVLARIAFPDFPGSRRFRWQWGGLALVFLGLSIDEVASIHERMGGALAEQMVDSTYLNGFLHYTWVIPGALLTLFLGLVYLKFLFHLPRATRRQFVIAAAMFVGGAIGIEMLNARQDDVYGWDSTLFVLGTAFEEFLEMIGIVIFLHALLSYLARDIFGQGRLTLEIAGTPSEDAIESTPPRRDQSATSPLPRPEADMVLVKPR